jgi:integrase
MSGSSSPIRARANRGSPTRSRTSFCGSSKPLGPKVSFHGLRHSYASISLRAGTPLKVVSEMLGHTTTAITADLYTHVLGDLKADAANRLDAIFQRAEKRRAVGAEFTSAWVSVF